MKESQGHPQLILYDGFGEREMFEINQKGWFDASVETTDGNHYTLRFYDPVRLRQTLEDCVKSGEPCLAEPNLIVIPEVTIEAIQDSIEFLWKMKYFDNLKCE